MKIRSRFDTQLEMRMRNHYLLMILCIREQD